MGIFEVLITFLVAYPRTITFLIAFLGGAELVLLLSIIAAQDGIHIINLMIFAALGIIVADILWFYIGRTRIISHFRKYKWVHKKYKRARKVIDRTTNDILLLSIAKTVRGIGLPIMMYMGRNRSFKKFIKYNIPISIVWAIAIVSFGWLAGKGYYLFVNVYKNVQLGILIALIILTLAYLIQYFIRKYLLKQEHLKNV